MKPASAEEVSFSHAVASPEFSRILRLDEITNDAVTVSLDTTLLECVALAERFDLPSVRNLSAQITYRRIRGGQMLRVQGHLSAAYSQLCSTTLVPMAMSMEETFQTEYTLSVWEKFSEFDLDQPEILTDDFLDIGEIAAQYFGLMIDPYARRADMEMLETLTEDLSLAVRDLVEQNVTAPAPESALENLLTEPEAEMLSLDYVAESAAPKVTFESCLPEFDLDDFIAEDFILASKPRPAPEAEANPSPIGIEMILEAPEAKSKPAAELQESLFYQHLRRLRAG